MRDSELEVRMCATEEATILVFRRWSTKERFVEEGDGEEAFNMTKEGR